MTKTTNQIAEQPSKGKFPTHVAKARPSNGGSAYERIGVAWENEDGSHYVKLNGTQVVSSFMLYPMPHPDTAGEEHTRA